MASVIAVAGALLLVAIAAPHLAPLDRVSPVRAASVWFAALLTRALIAAVVVAAVLFAIPQTDAFARLASLSTHEILPLFDVHMDLSVDPFAHGAVVLPGAALGGSLLFFFVTTALSYRAFNAFVSRHTLGNGPDGYVLVADERPLIAVPGFGPGRVIVSHGALALLDEQELDASLAHERAHIGRGHRAIGLAGALFARAGGLFPGTAAAHVGLRLSLERDADQDAVRQGRDPLALASAILKTVAGRRPRPSGSLALGGAELASVRLEQLIAGGASTAGSTWDRVAMILAALLALCCVGLMALIGWMAGSLGAGLAGLALALACPA